MSQINSIVGTAKSIGYVKTDLDIFTKSRPAWRVSGGLTRMQYQAFLATNLLRKSDAARAADDSEAEMKCKEGAASSYVDIFSDQE